MYNEVIRVAKEKMEKTTGVYKSDLRGLRAGRAFQNFSTALKVLLLAAIVGIGFLFGDGAGWRAGDAAELSRLIAEEDEIPDSLRAAYDKYAKMIQTDRDDAFLADAVRLLKSGDTALIAIGAAHIFGETGLAARLGALGYTVEVVERYLRAASGESA